ncbi:MAG: type II toxin-antitoxin system HipA family toxin [Pseudomonadota bacterium]
MEAVKAVQVNIWGQFVGAVAPLKNKPGFYEFSYAPGFEKGKLELSPIHMKMKSKRRFSFPALSQETFYGLPGMLADALPDKFGNALIEEYMSRRGIIQKDVTTLQRLLYVGRRSMGALEFEPAENNVRTQTTGLPLDMAHLVEDARRALKGEFSKVAQDIIDIGSSAGGARAKAVIGWNPSTNQVVSGQFAVPEGFEHWLLKFDVGTDGVLGTTAGFGRIEYAHYLMAIEAGIEMSVCRLLEENGRAHFMTKRFDRIGNEKLHLQSLCGLMHLDFNMPYVHSYDQYMRTILALNLGADALEQAWLRCAFNIAIVNCDDHTKNFGFIMNESGQWKLAPAYDNCFSHNPAEGKWTRMHQMQLNGKKWDITAEDLLDLAKIYDIRRPRERLQKIIDVVSHWPAFGKNAGVPKEEIRKIAAFQPDWVFSA